MERALNKATTADALASVDGPTIPQAAHQRWSLDFVADVLCWGRRFRILVTTSARGARPGRRHLERRPFQGLSGGQRAWPTVTGRLGAAEANQPAFSAAPILCANGLHTTTRKVGRVRPHRRLFNLAPSPPPRAGAWRVSMPRFSVVW